MGESPSTTPTYRYDAFISYSHLDEEWVHDVLLPRLERDGLTVCIDRRDFEIGVPSLVNMENAVQQSRKTLLVLTPDWVASEWTDFEALLIQTRDPVGRGRRMLPLMVRDCNLPGRLSIFTYLDLRNPADFDVQMRRLVAEIRGAQQEAPKREPVSPAPPSPPPGAGVPKANGERGVTTGGNVSNNVIIVGDGNVVGDSSSSRVEKGSSPTTPPRSPQTREGLPAWNTAILRDLFMAAFNDEELTTLCFDHFRPVYLDFSTGMSKGQKIQRLLDYCLRRDQVDALLAAVQEANPAQYARFASRLRVASLSDAEKRTPASTEGEGVRQRHDESIENGKAKPSLLIEESIMPHPAQIQPELLRQLRNILARTITDRKVAQLLAEDAGLSLADIDFSGAPTIFWQAIVDEARLKGRVVALLDRALMAAPAVDELRAVRRSVGTF